MIVDTIQFSSPTRDCGAGTGDTIEISGGRPGVPSDYALPSGTSQPAVAAVTYALAHSANRTSGGPWAQLVRLFRLTAATVAEEADWCQTPSQSIVTVANGQLNVAVPHPNLRGNPSPNYRATMTQDGSFSDQSASGSLSGRVSETDIDGRIDGAGCLYAFFWSSDVKGVVVLFLPWLVGAARGRSTFRMRICPICNRRVDLGFVSLRLPITKP